MTIPALAEPIPITRNGRAPHTELTAAATPLHLRRDADLQYLNQVLSSSAAGSAEAWKWYKLLGPVHKAISRTARLAGFGWLRAAEFSPDGKIVQIAETGPAAEIVEGIYSPYGGTRGLIERYFTLMKVPADSFLIRISDSKGVDGYHFLSGDEIEKATTWNAGTEAVANRGINWITMPKSAHTENTLLHRHVPANDFLGRVFVPGKQFVDVPDSTLAALATECELLHDMTEALKARIRSRFAAAGILFIPDSIHKIRVAGNKMGATDDEILNYLIDAMTSNIQRHDTAVALTPILVRGQEDAGEKIRHIVLDQQIFETDIKLRAELTDRILDDLDIQRQATEGNSESSRFTVWNSGDDERRYAIQPEMESFGWACTRLILQPELAAANEKNPGRWGVIVDLTGLSTRTNKQEDTRQAFDRFSASGKALRDASGIDERDAPSELEIIRQFGVKNNDPYLATFQMAEAEKIDWTKVGTAKAGPKSNETSDPTAGPGVGDPGNPNEMDKQ